MKTSYNEACGRDCSTLEQDLALCEQAGFDYIEIRLDMLRRYLQGHTAEQLRACGYEGMVSVETFRPEYWTRPPRWVVENACRTLRQALEESGCL